MTLRSQVAEGLHRLPPRLHALLPPEPRADLRHKLGRYFAWEQGFDRRPPLLRPGEIAGPPDFVGIGAQLCGAGWWYRLVADHPGVSVRGDIGMERHYLSHFCTQSFGAAEVRAYHGWFPRRSGTITGEWTPSYLARPWVAPLLARAAPDARLVVIVRDPVERVRRGLAHSTDGRQAHLGSLVADAVDRGFYAAQLRRLLEFFPDGQVLTLQYERCLIDPRGQLEVTYRFLGLDEAHHPVTGYGSGGRTGGRLPTLDAETTGRLIDIYAADVADLTTLVPELDLSLWPDFLDT